MGLVAYRNPVVRRRQFLFLAGIDAGLPEGVAELTKMFEELLPEAAARRKQVVIAIDGLDELPPVAAEPPYFVTEALPELQVRRRFYGRAVGGSPNE